jgi:hypothetical protein
MLKNSFLFFVLVVMQFTALKSFAVKAKLDFFKDNSLSIVDLPFPYYTRQENDVFVFVHQNSYGVFDVEDNVNKVIVTGPLEPCVAVAVTDGRQLVLFHANPSNRISHMKEVIADTFMHSDKNDIIVRIFGLEAEEVWERTFWNRLSGGNHLDFVKRIKATIKESGISDANITANRWSVKSAPHQVQRECNGIYYGTEKNISIRMNNLINNGQKKTINFWSIGSVAENVMKFADEKVDLKKIFGAEIMGFSSVNYCELLDFTRSLNPSKEQLFIPQVNAFYGLLEGHFQTYVEENSGEKFSPSKPMPFNSLDFYKH